MPNKRTVFRLPSTYIRAELHATGGGPPNKRPVLRFFDCRYQDQPLVCEAELGDFTGCALWFYKAELLHNYGYAPDSPACKHKIKNVRKALGYSYP